MGWKLAVLLLAVSVKDVHAAAICSCYQSGNYTGSSAPISNAYNNNDFSACFSTPCSYVAYSGDDTYGWTSFTFTWAVVTNSGGVLQVFDGTPDLSTSPTALITISEGENVGSTDPKSMIKSSSPRITIKYSQSSSAAANTYFGTIKAQPGLQPSAAPITTTAAPTTRLFTDLSYQHDPQFITHDIMVVVNQRTSGGIAALTNLNGIANNFVGLLSTTNDYNDITSTRLALATLTPYDPYYAIRGAIWDMNSAELNDNLPKSGVSIEGNIDKALSGLVELAFTVNTCAIAYSRTKVQRSVVLLTAEWPSAKANLSDEVKTVFDNFGVNLLVIGYNLTNNEWTQLSSASNRWYNALNAADSSPTSTPTFVNPYYFNDGSAQNYWCPQQPINSLDDGKSVYFKEPFNYGGASPGVAWKDPFGGQSTRYCNYANNQYIYKVPDGKSASVEVFYELEAGKDFLNFYDSSNSLIASFTGYEVSSSTFNTTSSSITARFTSDNKSVFRGFYVQITLQ